MVKDQIILKVVNATKTALGLKVIPSFKIETPTDFTHGDFSVNIALILAKELKKNPVEVAQKIQQALGLVQNIEKIEVVQPGFINFWLSKDYITAQLNQMLAVSHAGSAGKLNGKKVMVEFTDPNPFKELHIGHLYSNTIGESLSRIFEANGAIVFRADYFGDVGMHVAKAIWGLLSKLKTQNSRLDSAKRAKLKTEEKLEELHKKSLDERVRFLGEVYALGSNKYEKNEQVQNEVRHLNKLIYLAAQRMWEKEKGLTPQVDYRQGEEIDEKELNTVYELYTTGRKWSLESFEKIYARLGTKFDGYYPESIAGERGYKLVKDNIANGIFVESEGAIIFPGKNYNLHNRVFINKLGFPTYEAKELGLAPWKNEEFPYDLSVIVTGTEIQAYFAVLIAALKKVNPQLGAKTIPLLHGMLRLPEGKMSSRSGNVITGEWLLDSAKNKIRETYKDMTDETAEMVAVAAVKYALLKSRIGTDIIFNFHESINFEGNSGPYIQYTYVRTQSVLKKAKAKDSRFEFNKKNILQEKDEINILRHLVKFSDVLDASANQFAPHVVCTYLFELAQKFNLFYQKEKIIGSAEQNFRLALTQAVGKVLKEGLFVLGIKTPDKM